MNKYASRALPLDGGFIKVISYRSDSESNNDQWRRFLAAFFFLFFSSLVSHRAVFWLAEPGPHPLIGEKKKERVCIVLALHGGVVVLLLSPDPSLPNSGSSRLFVARCREAHGG